MQGTGLDRVAVLAFWLFNARSFMSYQLEVGGHAPAAAHYAGFWAKGTVWFSPVMSGMTAGLAGIGEVAGSVGQLNLNISPGYGFAAIIVAYLGRLHALGIILSGFLMALIYLGGEAGQVSLQLPAAITGVFQGMLLIGAVAGFAAAAETGYGTATGLPAGALAGAAAGMVFALFSPCR